MTAHGPSNMFESATRKMRIIRGAGFVHVIMEGEGAFVTPAVEFLTATRWAQGRMSTGNPTRDRALVLEKLETVIARPGSFVTTRGSTKYIESLVRLMKQNGFQLSEWVLPADLKEQLFAQPIHVADAAEKQAPQEPNAEPGRADEGKPK